MTLRKPPIAVPVPRIPRWRALDSAGQAHAFLGRQSPAACGARNQDERYDHPRRSKCFRCLEALEALMG